MRPGCLADARTWKSRPGWCFQGPLTSSLIYELFDSGLKLVFLVVCFVRNLRAFACALFSDANYGMRPFVSPGLGDAARVRSGHADAGRTKITPPVATG